jgi:DNA-binding transcriptional LysR family regulator
VTRRSPQRAPLSGSDPSQRLLLQRLRRTNLDLLPTLHTLLRTRSVTASAATLGITQPAVSKALRQLREVFDDDLIASLGREPRLTQRGAAIVEPLTGVLESLGLLLEPQSTFDPTVEPLHLVINTADYVSLLIAPELIRLCAVDAPKTDIQFIERAFNDMDEADDVDFMIAPRRFGDALGPRFESLPLWQDEMVCLASKRDKRFGDVLSQEEFLAARQVIYQLGETRRSDVAALIQPTAVLEVAPVCEVPNFLVMGAIVERAECLALMPRKVAQELARWREVRILDIDFPDRRLDIDAYWTVRAGSKRGHTWARALLARAARALAP